MTTLEAQLVLHGFMCAQFGYAELRGLLDALNDLADRNQDDGTSNFCTALRIKQQPLECAVLGAELLRYDENISAISRRLGMLPENGRAWKPFQYLALLFTERYLDLYFADKENLRRNLNVYKAQHRARELPDYEAADLSKLAFQSATGSGKTLLLHANILQYQGYLKTHQRDHTLNKIILVTPDEGLSRQHLRELEASKIPARLFADKGAADVFARGGALVEIIDLHKLDDKKGVKRVALESFEDNNLVLVDEGHLGTGGKVWRNHRRQLAKNGFTFEYSATFNQAVAGNHAEIKKLRGEYGKAILFDYSYKFFYADGYGKDYQITNLARDDDADTNARYLLACLLMFYQQCRIFRDKGGQWDEYNLSPPLWVFLGSTVIGRSSEGSRNTESDVARIIGFLAWVQRAEAEVVAGIAKLLNNDSGLWGIRGEDLFHDKFSYVVELGLDPAAVYADICETVFRGRGQVRVAHLRGLDELQLCATEGKPFAVVNVGDAAGLYNKLQAAENADFILQKDAFGTPLFERVDSARSPINIVIGARKFAAGWNSWRVSTMGLMHVGQNEGTQIIQMFGRGVRIKGYGMSLKREPVNSDAADRDELKKLETLNIFGLRANYMDRFRDYLSAEGLQQRNKAIPLFTTPCASLSREFKLVRKRADVGAYERSGERLDLALDTQLPDVRLDRYPRVESLESAGSQPAASVSANPEAQKLRTDAIDPQKVYARVLKRKAQRGWHNMRISLPVVEELLKKNDWYDLTIPHEKLKLSSFGRIAEWETLAVDLVCLYAEKFWQQNRNAWEHAHIEVFSIAEESPAYNQNATSQGNYVNAHKFWVSEENTELIAEIETLVAGVQGSLERGEEVDAEAAGVRFLAPEFHLYKPLLEATSASPDDIKITPLPLNEGEADFVRYLQELVLEENEMLRGKEVFLLRNLSRGRGISLFEQCAFYPDFILCVKDAKRQDVLFIDPKGLAYYNRQTENKVGLHERIKATQAAAQRQQKGIYLHSYIWSVTRTKQVGSDTQRTPEQWNEKGVYFADKGANGVRALVQDALDCP